MRDRAWVLLGLFGMAFAGCGSDGTRRDQHYGTDAGADYEGPSELATGGAGGAGGSGGQGVGADGGLNAELDDPDAEPAADGGTLDLLSSSDPD